MRHRKAGKKLNRDIKHRKALFKNLINGLIINEEIKTTESKAKAIRRLADKLINKGKNSSLNSRRAIAAFLQEKNVVNKIVDELGPRFKDRVSGFTRIKKIGQRRGDNAMMVQIELVEKKEKESKDKSKKATKRTSDPKKVKQEKQIQSSNLKSKEKDKTNKTKK